MKIVWKKFLEQIEEMEEDEEEPLLFERKYLTPMGYIPEDFNFWLGHADFHITREMLPLIKAVPGVEIIDVFSPYRFKVGVGLAFDDREVKRDIQKALGVYKRPEDIQTQIDTAKKSIVKPYWALYVAPNGQSQLTQSENMEEVYKELETYEATQKMVGGHVEYWRTQ